MKLRTQKKPSNKIFASAKVKRCCIGTDKKIFLSSVKKPGGWPDHVKEEGNKRSKQHISVLINENKSGLCSR